MKKYTTDRMILRPLKPQDDKIMLEFIERNRQAHQKFEMIRTEDYFTLENMRNLIDVDIREMEKGNMLRLYMFMKDNPDRIVGMFNFSSIVRGGFQSCFLGYKIDKQFEGQGLMKEALREGLRIIFSPGEGYNLHRVEANIMPWNIRSVNLAKSLGLTFEGRSRKYLFINGKWEDHDHYVILSDEEIK